MRIQRVIFVLQPNEDDIAEIQTWIHDARLKDPEGLGIAALETSITEYLTPLTGDTSHR
jgi:hypothetical protein